MAIQAVVLGANQPNPFQAVTWFSFALPEAGWVTLDVFDISGRRVATPVDAGYGAGWHRVAVKPSTVCRWLKGAGKPPASASHWN